MKNLAQNIASEYSEKDDVSCSIDPLLLVSISQILIEAFKLIKSCQRTKDKEEIEQMCFQPSGMQKLLLRRIVRKHVDQNTELTNGLMDAIIKQGGSLSPNSLWEIINEQV
mgnify:CR=1 FL=1